MITDDVQERVSGWFQGRLPASWRHGPPRVTVDREEITVVLVVEDVAFDEEVSDLTRAEARAGRARAFREDTREDRMAIAREAGYRFDLRVSWGIRMGEGEGALEELWTHLSAPVMTRLRQPERMVLDTLVDTGVARSRSDALAWCVRLVGQHEDDWLANLRRAMQEVADVRSQGPAA